VIRRRTALGLLVALLASAAALLAIELANGAGSYGEVVQPDPCTATVDYRGDGLDATLQRIALAGLNGAACELGATRAELVLSFEPSIAPKPIRWDRKTIERAVRSGLLEAVDDAQQRGSIGDVTAFVLRQIVERAPVGWFIEGADALGDLFG
jgi:hypothetical protein